ncbi:hypothetical protein ABEH28_03415 [Pseudomonas sp. Ps21-P2]|uniref:hypothetical protein n=1 Tax=Pseudomonas sp. Ps21-P2 TaxID=3080331 RepID=UPI003207D624
MIKRLKSAVRAELKNYTVYFSSADLPDAVVIPSSWSGFGLHHASSVWVPKEWDKFSSLLPTVDKWLRQCVVGTAVAVSDKVYLVYIYREDNELGLYLGESPVSGEVATLDVFRRAPMFERFYTNLHNGFCFYIDSSMGPSAIEDFVSIDDLIDDEPIAIPDMTGFFSNGAGDYITVVNGIDCPEFYIWWHEQQSQPERDIDVWAVIDAWMGIFLENADSNEDVIGVDL